MNRRSIVIGTKVFKEIKFLNGAYRYMLVNSDDKFVLSVNISGEIRPVSCGTSDMLLPEHLQIYDFVYEIDAAYYIVEQSGRFGVANLNRVLTKCVYDKIGDNIFNNHILVFRNKTPYALNLLNYTETVLPETVCDMKYISDLAILIKEGADKCILINKTGKSILSFNNCSLDKITVDVDEVTNSIVTNGQRFDLMGRKVMKFENDLILLDERFDACGDYFNGLARVRKAYAIQQPIRSYRLRDRRKPLPDDYGNLDKRYLARESEYEKCQRRWGYINIEGEEVIPCQFRSVGDFGEGLAMACYTNEYKGYINLMGDFVIPRKFSSCSRFCDGRAFVNGGFLNPPSVIDNTGKVVFSFKDISASLTCDSTSVSYIYDYKNGLARFVYNKLWNGKKYGFVDKYGNIVFQDLQYADDFNGKYINIHIGDSVFQMNRDGEVIVSNNQFSIKVPYYLICDFENVVFINNKILANYGKFSSFEGRNGYKTLITSNDTIITLPYMYESVEDSPKDNCLLVKKFDSNDVCRLSYNGYFLLESSGVVKEMPNKYYSYSVVKHTVQFYIVQSLTLSKGVVDTNGIEVIPCMYDIIDIDNDYQYIKCKGYEEYPRPFSQDFFCEVSYNVFYDFSFNQIIPDTVTGNTILKDRYDATRIFSANGLAAVCKDGRWGFVNKYGELAIPCIYLQVDDFKDGYCKAESDEDGWITINNDGEKL